MPYDFEADALILRELFGTAAHELGGLASALALRTDAVASILQPSDARGLTAVADELRTLGRQLRQLRGAGGSDQMAPGGGRTLATWVILVERFARPMLGRGIGFDADVPDLPLPPDVADALTIGVLSLCRAIRERSAGRSGRVQLLAIAHGDGLSLHIRVDWSGASPELTPSARRFLEHAEEVIAGAGLSWRADSDDDVRILSHP